MIIHFLFFLPLFLETCNNIQTVRKKNIVADITAVNLTFNLPITQKDGSIFNWTDSFQVYYYQDLVMYKFSYTFDSTFTDASGKETQIVEDVTRYTFFVYSKDSAYGYEHDPYQRDSAKKLQVDSVLNKLAFGTTNYYHAVQQNIVRLLSSKKDSISGILQEIYLPRVADEAKTNNTDTCYFSFDSNLNHLRFSLSKELDSLKKMKLFKIRVALKSSFNKEYKINVSKREVFFELKEISVPNKEKLIDFFNTRNKLLLK